MPGTRRGPKSSRYENHDKLKKQSRFKEPEDLVQSMMEEMSESNTDPEILVPINQHIEMIEEELQHKNFILMGPGCCGKSSTVCWLTNSSQ